MATAAEDPADRLTGNIRIPMGSPGDPESPTDKSIASYNKWFSSISAPATKLWVQERRKYLRSWTVFFDWNKFRPPINAQQLSLRLIRNVDYFQSNYLCVFLGLFLYCLISSPFILLVLASTFGACYIIRLKNAERKLKILGHELTLMQQYTLVFVATLALYYWASAGDVLFWVIGVSFFVIVLHASLFAIESLVPNEDGFELSLDTV